MSTVFRSWVSACALTGYRLLLSFLFLCPFCVCVYSFEVTVSSFSLSSFVLHRGLFNAHHGLSHRCGEAIAVMFADLRRFRQLLFYPGTFALTCTTLGP